MSNVGYCAIDFAEHGFSDVCGGGGVQYAPNWTCVARRAGKTNWCSYVIAGLSGWVVRSLSGGGYGFHWFYRMALVGGGPLCGLGDEYQYKTFM